MSKTKKEMAKSARENLRRATKEAKEASEKFKMVGDPDGKKLAEAAADAAQKGTDYVDGRLG